MINVGQPFKMEPLTRKAEISLCRAAKLTGITEGKIKWEPIGTGGPKSDQFLVRVHGDFSWNTLMWVQTQNDPDWKIV